MFSFGSFDSLANPPKMMAFCPIRLKECPRRGQGGSPSGVSRLHSHRLARSSYNWIWGKQTDDLFSAVTVIQGIAQLVLRGAPSIHLKFESFGCITCTSILNSLLFKTVQREQCPDEHHQWSVRYETAAWQYYLCSTHKGGLRGL